MTTARSSAVLLSLLAACSSPPPRPDAEPLFAALERGTAAQALEASAELAQVYDDSMRPRLARALEAAPARTLQLIGDLGTKGSARLLLERLPELLEAEPAVSRMAAVAAGLRRLRPATRPLLARFDRLDERAALRALGRIWERRLEDPPLAREEEIDRLSVFALAHRRAMGADVTVEACEALLKLMTRPELEDFLGKHAGDKFFARRFCDEAVRRKGFDAVKGARIHEALLASPDLALVAEILATSPHAIRPQLVRPFLDDRREAERGYRLCDAAATRLSGKSPATREERDALIRSLK
jgi:hypothetical protein